MYVRKINIYKTALYLDRVSKQRVDKKGLKPTSICIAGREMHYLVGILAVSAARSVLAPMITFKNVYLCGCMPSGFGKKACVNETDYLMD